MTQELIYEVDVENFVPDVLQKSQEVPVLVDFWAEWCGPCKALTPVLEKLARDYKGRFVLAKCNTEHNPEIAEKLRIRSIPAIKLFIEGKLAGEFTGAQPEAEIRRFIEHYCPALAEDPFVTASELAEGGQSVEALQVLAPLLSSQPGHDKARFLFSRLLLQHNRVAEAETVMKGFKEGSPDLLQLQKMTALYREAADYGELKDLQAAAAKDPGSLENLYRLAVRLALDTRFEQALEGLIQILQKDKNFGDGKARRTLLALFEVIGLHNPLSDQYRKKMARIIL